MSKKNTILKFIENGEKIVKEEFHPASDGFPFSYVAGPKFTQWMSQIEIFAKRFLSDHPLSENILALWGQSLILCKHQIWLQNDNII